MARAPFINIKENSPTWARAAPVRTQARSGRRIITAVRKTTTNLPTRMAASKSKTVTIFAKTFTGVSNIPTEIKKMLVKTSLKEIMSARAC